MFVILEAKECSESIFRNIVSFSEGSSAISSDEIWLNLSQAYLPARPSLELALRSREFDVVGLKYDAAVEGLLDFSCASYISLKVVTDFFSCTTGVPLPDFVLSELTFR